MEPEPTYSITVFAQLAGVTVRTLHYYEEAGLLTPSRRTARGHRRYSPDDLLRLQQILTLKYLGFSLGQAQTLLGAPGYDVRVTLRAQQQALEDDILPAWARTWSARGWPSRSPPSSTAPRRSAHG